MTNTTRAESPPAFASGVAPLAAQMRSSRAQVIEFARSAPASIWDKPSALGGWTNRDLLAHLAGGNDQMLQRILRAAVAREPLDPAVLEPDTDGENAAGVAERRSSALESLIAELERDGDEMRELLAGVRDEDMDLHPAGASWTLGGLFRLVLEENHDLEHLEQLRAALPRRHRFAAWVEPVAANLSRTRREVVEFGSSAPEAFWALPSPNAGWTNKDLLAHLATSHWVQQANIASVLSGVPFRFAGPDVRNTERVSARRDTPVAELVAEVEAEGLETQALLAELTEEHEPFRREGAPFTLGEALRGFTKHDRFHLDQLREGLRASGLTAEMLKAES